MMTARVSWLLSLIAAAAGAAPFVAYVGNTPVHSASPDAKIMVVDSLLASGGQALLIYHAIQQREAEHQARGARFVDPPAVPGRNRSPYGSIRFGRRPSQAPSAEAKRKE